MTRAKRLTHEESKAQTRSRLIEVGREHFLRYGFSKSTAEAIAEEAGYTRGALRSNFGDKEGLLLAVVIDAHRAEAKMFKEVVSRLMGEDLLTTIRSSFVDLLADPDYLLLLEFDLEALRSEKLREGYMAFHEELMRDSCNILEHLQKNSGVVLAVPPKVLILMVHSFSRGLAAQQKLLVPALTSEEIRMMMCSVFDCLILHSGDRKKAKVSPKRKS